MRRPLVLPLLLLGLAACDDDPEGPTGPATLVVTITRSGAGTDADGFGISVDGAAQGTTGGTGGTFTASGMTAGSHTVTITGIAANCSVSNGAETRTVSLIAGQATTLTFQIACT